MNQWDWTSLCVNLKRCIYEFTDYAVRVYTTPHHDLMMTSYELILGHHELIMRFCVDWGIIRSYEMAAPDNFNRVLVKIKGANLDSTLMLV